MTDSGSLSVMDYEIVASDLYNPLSIDLHDAVKRFQASFLDGIPTATTMFLDRSDLDNLYHFVSNPASTPKTKVLDSLSRCMLNPRWTQTIVKLFRPIAMDLVARWTMPGFTTFLDGAVNRIEFVAKAFSIVLPILPQVKSLAVTYFTNSPSLFERLDRSTTHYASVETQTTKELQELLLTAYRLVSFSTATFAPLWNWGPVVQLLRFPDIPVRYLAVLCLSKAYKLSEAQTKSLLGSLSGQSLDENEEPLYITVDDGTQIDLRILSLWEEQKLAESQISLTHNHYDSTNASPENTLLDRDLCPLTCNLCGVLLPKSSTSDSSSSFTSKNSLVLTETTKKNLHTLSLAFSIGAPTFLEGVTGAGKTALVEELARRTGRIDKLIKIHLGDQTDPKVLLGTYVSTSTPGSFRWQPGVLTTAVEEGRWVLIEDIDLAPAEVISILLPLLETRCLFIPSRGEKIKAKEGFQLFGTRSLIATMSGKAQRRGGGELVTGANLWTRVHVEPLSMAELEEVVRQKFPYIGNFAVHVMRLFAAVTRIYQDPNFTSLSTMGRYISTRDLMKWCYRINTLLGEKLNGNATTEAALDEEIRMNLFSEAIDCFCGMIPDYSTWVAVLEKFGEPLQLSREMVRNYVDQYKPSLYQTETTVSIGRVNLSSTAGKQGRIQKSVKRSSSKRNPFAITGHALRLLEKIAVCVHLNEPTLLVGETGTGKTTVVQQLADMLHQNLVVVNLSQQSDSSDLLGGFKPVEGKILAMPLKEDFEALFEKTFSVKKNAKFLDMVRKTFVHQKWKNFSALLQQAVKMAEQKFEQEQQNESSTTKRKSSPQLRSAWKSLSARINDFEVQQVQAQDKFVFNFMEGALVKAVRRGDWILLDEINLATTETLECLSGLLQDAEGSLILTEKGDVEPIRRHPNFRLFACMNPATDVGKRDLPPGLRNRFTEFYVHPPDSRYEDLLQIVQKYLAPITTGNDERACDDVAEFYVEAKKLAQEHKLVDGANQKPHFSMRTLSRALAYVVQIYPTYGLRRSLYEGFCMTFLTQLSKESEALMRQLVYKTVLRGVKNPTHLISQIPRQPGENYIQFGYFWLEQGQFEPYDDGQYILTSSVEANLYNLARVIMSRKFPVLIQGPTSAGKTSMIEYLAKKTGHRFVRINNHEHTDLQEYLGTYVSNAEGKLEFQEGVLVEALRNGYWIVLDELNLAPSDVLEALNRLLDDNRELLIPETQEVVKPHPHFMLFATQNPAGLYGGRKALSRAFRNRFLELHFDDIPQDELETILSRRCQIAPSYCKKLVQVYKSLMERRKSSRIFEQKHSFITLRDLFRWAGRDPNGYQELAEHGYMLLAERCRKDEEKMVVKQVLENVMKVKLDEDEMYNCERLEEFAIYDRIMKEKATQRGEETRLVWTKAMRRLFSLVARCLRYNEPVLLVGETGCGKTTVCQMLAETFQRELHIVNCHQNTETSDLLGGQRPVRNKKSEQQQQLFEWHDGPLVQAMRGGHLFLLDEISLADDSVLERLNSVLEPSRLLVLAEKGGRHVEELVAKEGFQFLATMNPGGDYGKKELSPALRNRFTEIWVPTVNDREDLQMIIDEQLLTVHHPNLKDYGTRMLDFIEWFTQSLGQTSRTVVSLRDILSWVRFICAGVERGLDPELSFAHGGCLVLLDGLGSHGASGSSFLAGEVLKEFRLKCLKRLAARPDAEKEQDILGSTKEITINDGDTHFGIGPFQIPRGPLVRTDVKFTLLAPTTADNAMRVMRAMQLKKPILLEGSPGVGKTSLISALAAAAGHRLVRINLSEQTDLMDLFGSDLPVEGGESGEFAWRDAPFLQAMKAGDWVLLDELNLASQSVLEGLNSCLDHRGAVYIPELDREFSCAKEFRVFGAQNPLQQGGGRKGLPKSFINRFTQVYVEHLSADDLLFICAHLFPQFDMGTLQKMIEFNTQMYEETMVRCRFGRKGSPWEFNLRDVFRWLELMQKDNVNNNNVPDPSEYLGTIYLQRMRTHEDREKVIELYQRIFETEYARPSYPPYTVSADYLRVGHSCLPRLRQKTTAVNDDLLEQQESHILHTFLAPLEALMKCVELGWMAIVTGPSASGKTSIVRLLSKLTGNKLQEFAMNNSVDTMELLGGFEQVDLNRHRQVIMENLEELTDRITRAMLMHLSEVPEEHHESVLQQIRKLNDLWFTFKSQHAMSKASVNEKAEFDYTLLSSIVSLLQEAASHVDPDVTPLINKTIANAENLSKLEKTSIAGKFEWIDGLLIKALEEGHWLLIDNANLCNPSVLDRLNPLFENNGVLMVNERGLVDGEVKVIKPHPNFRMFMTVDPANGELSRAMRNRGIEIALIDANWNRNTEDVKRLANGLGVRGAKLPLLLNELQQQQATFGQKRHLSRQQQSVRDYLMLATYVMERLQRGQSLKSSIQQSFYQVFVDGGVKDVSEALIKATTDAENMLDQMMASPGNCPYFVGGSLFESDSALAMVTLQGAYLIYLLQQPCHSKEIVSKIETAGDVFLETLSVHDVGLRMRWLSFMAQQSGLPQEKATVLERLLYLLKTVREHPVLIERMQVERTGNLEASNIMAKAYSLLIRLCKLSYEDETMRKTTLRLKPGSMTALQQSYCFHDGRLSESQLLHPIVKEILPIFLAIREGVYEWIRQKQYKSCLESSFVVLGKILDARDYAWMTAHSRTLSLDYFLNSLRYMQEQIQSEDSFVTIFSNALRLMDNVMSGFDFETCKSMKALWKHFCPSTLFSESLYYVESKLRQINSALDNYKPDQDTQQENTELVLKIKSETKETLVEGIATLYAVDKNTSEDAQKLAKSLEQLPEHLEKELDDQRKALSAIPHTSWDMALVPLYDFSSITNEMELLTVLYLKACLSNDDAALQDFAKKIEAFKRFAHDRTSRPPVDLVPYQRLIWLLDSGYGVKLSTVLPGLVHDAAHIWHQRLWRSGIGKQRFYQLISPGVDEPALIEGGSQNLYQGVETIVCLNILSSVEKMSADAYDSALDQLKALKQYLATNIVLRDKLSLELAMVISMAYQLFSASTELMDEDAYGELSVLFDHLLIFAQALSESNMYSSNLPQSQYDHVLQAISSIKNVLQAGQLNQFYDQAMSSIRESVNHHSSRNYNAMYSSLGLARVLLALCFISAYIPGYPVDPTAEPRLRVDLLQRRRDILINDVAVRTRIEELITGDNSNTAIKTQQAELSSIDAALSSSVTTFSLRPAKSQLDDIFIDLSYVQKHLLTSNIESLVKELMTTASDKSFQQENLLQGTIIQFIDRMQTKYPLYRDILQPLLVAVNDVKYGLRLIRFNARKDKADAFLKHVVELFIRNPDATRSLDLNWRTLTEPNQLTKLKAIIFERAPTSRKWSLYLRLLIVILERFAVTLEAHGYIDVEDLVGINNIFRETVSIWKSAQEYKRQKEAEKEQLFKTRTKKYEPVTEEELEEQDMKKTFADFNEEFADLEENEEGAAKQMSSVEVQEESVVDQSDIQRIALLHKTIFDTFVHGHCTQTKKSHDRENVRSYHAAGQLASMATSAFSHTVDYACSAGHLRATSLAIRRLETDDSFSMSSDDLYDFYTSENVQEAKRVAPVLRRFKDRVRQIQEEWPDHAVLQQLIVITDRILGFSILSPVAKFLTGVELLLQKSEDWEAYAAKHVSLAAQREELTGLIIRWRQLELNCWPKLLAAQEQAQRSAAYEWWFHLYDAVNNTTFNHGSEDEKASSVRNLLAALDQFMQSASLVEYPARLKMVDSFCRQAEMQAELAGPGYNENDLIVATILRNVHLYYSQFQESVDTTLVQLRKPIEKELKDFVKIASWKDVNIYALRQSAQKTHRQLHKCIRKYREVLSMTMYTVIAKYDQELPMFQYGDEKRYDDVNMGLLEQLGQRDMWLAKTNVEAAHLNHLAYEVATPAKRHLADLQATLNKVRRYCRDDLIATDGSRQVPLEVFMTDVIQTIKTFQKETPAVITDENKSQVKHQKLMKKKALVDFLKELRRLGLRSRPGQLTKQNANMAYLFSQHVAAMESALKNRNLQTRALSSYSGATEGMIGLWRKANDYYFRSIARLSHLRTVSTTQVSKDISMLEVERSMSATEHMFSLVTKERSLAARFEERLNLLQCASIQLASLYEGSLNPVDITVGRRLVLHKRFLDELAYNLSEASSTLNIQAEYQQAAKNASVILQRARDTIQELQASTNTCFVRRFLTAFKRKYLLTADVSDMIDAHTDIITNVHKTLMDLVSRVPTMTHSIYAILKSIDVHLQTEIGKENGYILSVTAAELRDKLYSMIEAILVAVQDMKKVKAQGKVENDSEEEQLMGENYIREKHNLQFALTNALHMDVVSRRCLEAFDAAHDLLSTDAEDAVKLLKEAYPFLQQYLLIVQHTLAEFLVHHKAMAKFTYALVNSFSIIISKGFCMPEGADEGEEGEAEGMATGTGIGEGEGTKDVSDEIEDEEQVLGTQNEERQPNPKSETKEEKKGLEMENDFEGELEDIEHDEEEQQKDSDQDEEDEEELDDQIGDVDDMDPDAVDDKMWGDDEAHEERKDTDKTMDQQGKSDQKESDIVAKEEDDQQQHQRQPESKGEEPEASKEPSEQEMGEEEMSTEEMEGDEEAENRADEQMNVEVPEAETLELPEDLKMDDNMEEEQEQKEEFVDAMDMDETPADDAEMEESDNGGGEEVFQDPLNEVDQEDEEMADASTHMDTEVGQGEDEEDNELEDATENQEADKLAGDEQQQHQHQHQQQQKEGEVTEDEEQPEQNTAQNREHPSNEQDAAENQFGVQAQAGKMSMTSVGQQQGENEASESTDAPEEPSEQREKKGMTERGANQADEDANNQDEDREPESSNINPQRSLGDALESWRRRLADVADAEETENEEEARKENDPQSSSNEVNEKHAFEYLQNDEEAHDMQTMGNAAKDQVQELDLGAMDEELHDEDEYAGEMETNDKQHEDDFDTLPLPRDALDTAGEKDRQGAIVSKRTAESQILEQGDVLIVDESVIGRQPLDQEDIEHMRQELETTVAEWREEGRDINRARELWQRYENLTHDLAMGLCEQLRLILEPTLATKLKGDYRTGKRLNMKKIIPYIASQFKKDKIWLRRTKPSKRQYQVMISVDDSRSMSESRSVQLAYETLSLISKALSHLEVGDISITSFGERVSLLHPFDQPFTADAGASVLQQFTFGQQKTHVKNLIQSTLSLFENAKSSSSTQELWQLQLIISDGICEDHETLKQLVRRAMDQQVMIIFIVVDNKPEKDSILNMTNVKYTTVDGKLTLQMKPYLETFPFQYFMVLRDINALPEALSDALRQYFSFVSA